ncbi:MAG: DUF4347 domain-containing protein [Cyanobacteria bacterium J06633_2]
MHAVQPQHTQPISNAFPFKAKTLIIADPWVSIPQATLESSVRAIALTVNSNKNVFQLISSTLHCHPTINSLHLFAHCQSEAVKIGSARLDIRTLEQYSWDLHSWFFPTQPHLSHRQPEIYIHSNSPDPIHLDSPVITMLTQLTGAKIILA